MCTPERVSSPTVPGGFEMTTAVVGDRIPASVGRYRAWIRIVPEGRATIDAATAAWCLFDVLAGLAIAPSRHTTTTISVTQTAKRTRRARPG